MPKALHFDEKLLRDMHAQDLTHAEMAEVLGCNRTTVQRKLYALGLKKARTGPKSGERHPDWKGGVTIRKGYRLIYMPEHPNAINGRYVAEHRLVMEQKLGRHLTRKEVVHHIDGDPLNNDLSNLVLFRTNGDHLKHELTRKIPNWTEDGKKRIAAGIVKSARLRSSQKK